MAGPRQTHAWPPVPSAPTSGPFLRHLENILGHSGAQEAGGSPESHLPSRGWAAEVEIGRTTGGAAGRSPRAGGRGRLSQARRRKGAGPTSPRCHPTSMSCLGDPVGAVFSLPPPTASPLPAKSLSYPHPKDGSPTLPSPPGLRDKSRLCSLVRPLPSWLHSAVEDDSSSLQSRRPWSASLGQGYLDNIGDAEVSHACAGSAQAPGTWSVCIN